MKDYALIRLVENIKAPYDYDKCLKLTVCCKYCTFDIDNQDDTMIFGYPVDLEHPNYNILDE
jgi:hypothetical protein